jgi:hypothetical protein
MCRNKKLFTSSISMLPLLHATSRLSSSEMQRLSSIFNLFLAAVCCWRDNAQIISVQQGMRKFQAGTGGH